MKDKTKKIKKRPLGPIVEIIIFILFLSFVCFLFNLIGVSGYKTEAGTFETTLVVVKNVFSKDGIKTILSKAIYNFKDLEPLVMIILSLISVSVLEASGLLKHLFTSLKKFKPSTVTMIVMFTGIISTIIGDYSYALLLPLAGILYKYIGKDSRLGIMTMFIAITIGYGTGLIYDYKAYELGNITELSASSIISNYNYELLSNIFILLSSTVMLTIIGMVALNFFSKKFSRNEYTDNLVISKKAAKTTLIAFIIMILVLVYCIIPGLPHSGLLIDRTAPTYVEKLFGSNSIFSQGLILLIMIILMVCGFIYGIISRNIKNSQDYSKALTKTFEGTGPIFVLLFFISIVYLILDWSNLSTVITTNLVDFIGKSNLSGVLLIIITFLSIVIISTLIPSTIVKWNLISPIYIPLLMRANISPSFVQTIFVAADSVGKLLSPIYVYLIVTVGLIYKYDKEDDNSIIGTMKTMMPYILILSLVWLVIIVGWYLLGLPMGISSSITL